MESQAPGSGLAQLQLLWPLGEGSRGCATEAHWATWKVAALETEVSPWQFLASERNVRWSPLELPLLCNGPPGLPAPVGASA